MLERIEASTRSDIMLLHIRGGVSGSLEYIVPSHAIVTVHVASRRAFVDNDVAFEPDALANDGRVIMIATFPSSDGPRC